MKQELLHLTVGALLWKCFFLLLFHCTGRGNLPPADSEQGEGAPAELLSPGTGVDGSGHTEQRNLTKEEGVAVAASRQPALLLAYI